MWVLIFSIYIALCLAFFAYCVVTAPRMEDPRVSEQDPEELHSNPDSKQD